MATWTMQYRTKETSHGEWTEWKDLSRTLTYSSYYQPLWFEFRAVAEIEREQRFSFIGDYTVE